MTKVTINLKSPSYKYHLFESYFIIYLNQNMTCCNYIMLTIMPIIWLYTFKNITTFNHKITSNIPYELLHSQKYDLHQSYFTSIKKATHEGHIPHQWKIWSTRVIFYINMQRIWPMRVIFKSTKNMTHKNHISHHPKIWLQKSYASSAKIWLTIVILHVYQNMTHHSHTPHPPKYDSP